MMNMSLASVGNFLTLGLVIGNQRTECNIAMVLCDEKISFAYGCKKKTCVKEHTSKVTNCSWEFRNGNHNARMSNGNSLSYAPTVGSDVERQPLLFVTFRATIQICTKNTFCCSNFFQQILNLQRNPASCFVQYQLRIFII